MRRRRIVIALGVVAVLVAVVVVTVVVVRQRAAAARTFEVNGQDYTCYTSGQVRLEATVQYPDPDASFTLDGQRQPAAGDDVSLRMLAAPVYSCADGQTHHLHIKSGQREPFDPGCDIELTPAVLPAVVGRDAVEYIQRYQPDSSICDLSWTD